MYGLGVQIIKLAPSQIPTAVYIGISLSYYFKLVN